MQGDSCLPGDHAKDGKPCPPDQAAAHLAQELADEAAARKLAGTPTTAVKASGTAKVKVKDNGEYYLTLAKQDGNRIVALNDRIKAVAPVAGGVDYDVDHDLGTLYVHITPPPGGSIVPFYVVTEKGMTYKILGTVQDVPSVQVILNNSDLQDDAKATDEPGASNRQARITDLIRSMATGKTLPGYDSTEPRSETSVRDGVQALIQLQYTGRDFGGLKVLVKNSGILPVTIAEPDFARLGKLAAVWVSKQTVTGTALSLNDHVIAPGEVVPVYVVLTQEVPE